MNNNKIYNGALSGVIAGLMDKRVRFNSYIQISNTAVLFATEVDNLIAPIIGGASSSQEELMSQICQAAVSGIYIDIIPVGIVNNVVTAWNNINTQILVDSLLIGEKINVRDYGAKGDGITDDTAAINLALTAASVVKRLYFPKGIYITSAQLNVSIQGMFIFGIGRESVIRNIDPSVASVFYLANDDISIEHLRIEGMSINSGDGIPLPHSTQWGIKTLGDQAHVWSVEDGSCRLDLIAPGDTLTFESIDDLGSVPVKTSGPINVIFQIGDNGYCTGSCHLTNGNTTIVGTGTSFLSEFYPGCTVLVEGQYVTLSSDPAVYSLWDDTHINLSANWTGTTDDFAEGTVFPFPNVKLINRINEAGAAISPRYDEVCNTDYINSTIPDLMSYTRIGLTSAGGGTRASLNITGGTALAKLGLTITQTYGLNEAPRRCIVNNVSFGGPDNTHRLNNAILISSGDDWTVTNIETKLMGYTGVYGTGYSILCGNTENLIVQNNRAYGDAIGGRHLLYLGGGNRDTKCDVNYADGLYSSAANIYAYAYQPANRRINIGKMTVSNQQVGLDGVGAITIYPKSRDITVGNESEFTNCGRNGVIVSTASVILALVQSWMKNIVIDGIRMQHIGQSAINIEGAAHVKIRNIDIIDSSERIPGTYGAVLVNSFNCSIADDIDIDEILVKHTTNTPLYPNIIRLEPTATGPKNVKIGSNIRGMTGSDGGALGMIARNNAIPINLSTVASIIPPSHNGISTTPSVLGGNFIYLTGLITVTNLLHGQERQIINVLTDGQVTLARSFGGAGQIIPKGTNTCKPLANDMRTFISLSGSWQEITQREDFGTIPLISGGLTATGAILSSDGTAALPGISFTNEPGLGWMRGGGHFANFYSNNTLIVQLIDTGGYIACAAGARYSWSATGIGFLGQAPAGLQVVAGSKAGNAALASLITALATYGLVQDTTT
jgi:hypothetical protein